ncbi:MAG: hypothetical protein HDQ92_01975 [Desulfovibrio sp.]|nr:hypothetical protein [Desulfovibrio sp.]
MEKKQYTFSMTLKGDESDRFSLELAFDPPLKQHELPIPSVYHFGMVISRVVAICSANKEFGEELLELSERYEGKIMKEVVNE